jgi:hypothetical protein
VGNGRWRCGLKSASEEASYQGGEEEAVAVE